MKKFSGDNRWGGAAVRYADEGGQALHVWHPPRCGRAYERAPECFRKAADAGACWAHLFDQDTERLIETAKALGVKRIKIHGKGRTQHVDLCGRPLRLAVGLCREGRE